MSPIAILLLAAGSSSRMGSSDKLLEKVAGEPLIALICRRAALTGLQCYVTLPDLQHPRAKWIDARAAASAPLDAIASAPGSVALVSAVVEVRGTAPGMFATQ